MKIEDGTKTRLFDLFAREQHTILAFNTDKEAAAEIVSWERPGVVQSFTVSSTSAEGDTTFLDDNGNVHSTYGAEDEVIFFVIRPDAVVGSSTNDVKGIKRYFEKGFGGIAGIRLGN